jgi:pyruvate,water dikinase
MMRAIGLALNALFGSSEAAQGKDKLRGLAASRGIYEGPARRVSHPAEFDRIVRGDVLVTESTTEAFNILLPLLGAIVTDSGGLLSHSAIVARSTEFRVWSERAKQRNESLTGRRCGWTVM